jgi:glycosyltransferase involved in cell wall biosynthesis
MNEHVEAVPALRICLPVYNGENHGAMAIASMLTQTFADFELITTHNASTDRTEEICRKFADVDPRIRYHRNERNVGGAHNQAIAVQLSRGRYVRLSGHDDIASTHLEECVAVLEERPDVVIAFTSNVEIDQVGLVIRHYHNTPRYRCHAIGPLPRVDLPGPKRRCHLRGHPQRRSAQPATDGELRQQ